MNKNGLDAFKKWREAYDAMNNDQKARILRDKIAKRKQLTAEMEKVLMGYESHYRAEMATCAMQIETAVLERGETVTEYNVCAKYSGGRGSTSWKSVAVEMNAPDDLIAKHSKPGTPKVTISPV